MFGSGRKDVLGLLVQSNAIVLPVIKKLDVLVIKLSVNRHSEINNAYNSACDK